MRIGGVGAIVTGGASGLGGATAAMLAEAGALVTIFDMNAEAGAAQAAAIGGRFTPVDVTDEAAVAEAVAAAEAAHGVTRILVNCAGIAIGSRTVSRENTPHALSKFRKVIEVNLVGSFCTAAAVAARLVPAEAVGEERGIIVHTASIAAFEGQVGQTAYAASKGGIVGLTLPMARDLAPFGIRVVTIAPGIFWTPMLGGMAPEVQESLGRQVPFPSRLGQPAEYAQLAKSLIENPMMNGTVVRLDGAIRMGPK